MPDDGQILARLVKRMHNKDLDPLRPLIDAYLIERDKAADRLQEYNIPMLPRERPPGRLSPSTIGGCERQAAFKFLGVPGKKRLDPDLELLFEDGNWRHHRWQAMFCDMEKVLGKEKLQVISIEEFVKLVRFFIAGSLDVLLKIHGVKWVIDIKGINDYGFSRITLNDEPVHEHVRQLLAYMKARRVPRGMLLYENKNNQKTQVFTVRFNAAEWAEIEEWCERVIRRMRRKELPPMAHDCEAGNYLFEKCPWANQCYGRRSHEQVRRIAYKGFNNPEEAWNNGNST